jgi:hypothetical protein
MTESSLKSALMLVLKKQLPSFVALRHEDIRTNGIPDASITACGKTSWWEFKFARPNFDSSGIQELTMCRLAAAGFARYVIWWETAKGNGQRTLIVTPKEVSQHHGNGECLPEFSTAGFDHKWLVNEIRKVHRV